jgi:hypothetical protein
MNISSIPAVQKAVIEFPVPSEAIGDAGVNPKRLIIPMSPDDHQAVVPQWRDRRPGSRHLHNLKGQS